MARSEAVHREHHPEFLEVDAHTPCLRSMNPPIVAPANLPLPLAVAGCPRRLPAYAIEYWAFTVIRRCFQLKTSKPLSQMEYCATAPLFTSSDVSGFPKDPRAPRSITQVRGTGKRQGTKPEGEK